jgi:hypothetical protein
MLKRPVVRMAVLGVTLLGSATAFYFIAPVFMRDAAASAYPYLAYMPTRTERPPTDTPLPTETSTEIPTEIPNMTVQLSIVDLSSATLVARGEFYPLVHSGSGEAYLHEVDDELVLSLSADFQVEDGPDLHVYLAAEDPVPNESGEDLAGALDLGELIALEGEQSYALPDGVQLDDYESVVIWCVPFEVPFIAAPIETP